MTALLMIGGRLSGPQVFRCRPRGWIVMAQLHGAFWVGVRAYKDNFHAHLGFVSLYVVAPLDRA